MKWHTRVLMASVAVLAAGVAGIALAGDEQEARAAVRKLADAVAKNDDAAVKQGADDIAKKYELEEVMHSFQLRTKKGEGVGDKPGAITPDGIEAKFIALGKKPLPPATLNKEAAAIARAAYLSAAIAEVAERKTPEKKEGNKDPKDWLAWCKDMKAGSLDLARAAKAKDAKGVKDAASKVNSSCNNCHRVFRD
jgi:Cytochrome C'